MSDDEIWATLLKFHREVFLPDFRRLMQEALGPVTEELRATNERFEAEDARTARS